MSDGNGSGSEVEDEHSDLDKSDKNNSEVDIEESGSPPFNNNSSLKEKLYNLNTRIHHLMQSNVSWKRRASQLRHLLVSSHSV